MTEAAFQAARKIMQKANYWRGMITTAKGNVAKWTRIEDVFRKELNQTRADGAKKMLDKALIRLEQFRQKFAEIEFPDSHLKSEIKRCTRCGGNLNIPDGCLCDQY